MRLRQWLSWNPPLIVSALSCRGVYLFRELIFGLADGENPVFRLLTVFQVDFSWIFRRLRIIM